MSSQPGIQELMTAETKASQIIAEARQQRVERMKLAKVDAEQVIVAYRAEREALFAEANAKDASTTGSDFDELNRKTQQDVDVMRNDFAQHKDKVLDMMVSYVTTLDLNVSDARNKKN